MERRGKGGEQCMEKMQYGNEREREKKRIMGARDTEKKEKTWRDAEVIMINYRD